MVAQVQSNWSLVLEELSRWKELYLTGKAYSSVTITT
jgi:hypothetical protein